MVFITALLIGYLAAMLRSAVAVVLVSFLLTLVFIVSFVLSGTSVLSLLIAIAGFNAGLVCCATAYLVRTGFRTA
jgi:hypothetical protein